MEYPYVYLAPSNTGIPSGFDFDNNGEAVSEPGSREYGNDAYGYGVFPGQYAMVLYSKYPIVEEDVRTFQTFLWKDMPGALLPDDPDTPEPNDWYSEEELVDGEIVHVLASHPTPSGFDSSEDRNGTRNHDEIRFWSDYITPEEGEESNFYDVGEDEKYLIQKFLDRTLLYNQRMREEVEHLGLICIDVESVSMADELKNCLELML